MQDTLIAEPMFPDDETPEQSRERLFREWQSMIDEDPPYMLHRSELAADDAEHFTGEYAVFHPIKGAYSFETEEEAVAFMTEE